MDLSISLKKTNNQTAGIATPDVKFTFSSEIHTRNLSNSRTVMTTAADAMKSDPCYRFYPNISQGFNQSVQ